MREIIRPIRQRQSFGARPLTSRHCSKFGQKVSVRLCVIGVRRCEFVGVQSVQMGVFCALCRVFLIELKPIEGME